MAIGTRTQNTTAVSPYREGVLARYATAIAPWTLTVLRVVVGATMLLHGLPKFQNLGGTIGFFGMLGVPAAGVMAPFIATLEVVGGLLLILGLGTRLVALLFVVEMLVAVLLVKSNVGYIAPPQAGAGAELDTVLAAAALVLFAFGPGQLSVDRNVLRREL